MNRIEKLIETSLNFSYVIGNTTSLNAPRDSGWRLLPFSVCLCLEGEMEYHFAGSDEIVTVKTDESLLIPSNRKFRHFIKQDIVSQWCHFHVTVLNTIDLWEFYEKPVSFNKKTSARLQPIIEQLNYIKDSQILNDIILRKNMGMQLVYEICRNLTLKTNYQQKLQVLSRLDPVLNLMDQKIRENVSLSELANAASLSKPRFIAFFREQMGMTPKQYFNYKRILSVGQALVSTDKALEEIAQDFGFYDSFHLSHNFKRIYGLSPKKFRDDQKNSF